MKKNKPPISFIPGLDLFPEIKSPPLPIKGEVPQLVYSFTLLDLYPDIPALPPKQALQQIKKLLDSMEVELVFKRSLKKGFELPHTTNDLEAIKLLDLLFDPGILSIQQIDNDLSRYEARSTSLLDLQNLSPFPLVMASADKILHTLRWIDSNIKIKVERIGKGIQLSSDLIRLIVESVLKIYCYLVKMHNHQLASSINFNYSMFFQDRIVSLIFGETALFNQQELFGQATNANAIALDYLKNLGDLSLDTLCRLSVFMGITETSVEHIQRDFSQRPDAALIQVEDMLNLHNRQWGVNHIDQFLQDLGTDHPIHLVLVLDDNGESIFDLAIVQQLLNASATLKVQIVVNRYPISINISLEVFQHILKDPYFESLNKHFQQQRARLLIEEQVFRSFEPEQLKPLTKQAISDADLLYIKGVSFFETFQLPKATRFHAFTVSGYTNQMLTGYKEGEGVFVKLLPGQMGYSYEDLARISTLKQQIEKK